MSFVHNCECDQCNDLRAKVMELERALQVWKMATPAYDELVARNKKLEDALYLYWNRNYGTMSMHEIDATVGHLIPKRT